MATMTLEEALFHAEQFEKNDAISTSAKAVRVLAAEIKRRQNVHNDDLCVDLFAEMMKQKLAKAREKGRSGWDNPHECDVETLALMMVEHVVKGDVVDIANFCMMLSLRGANVEHIKEAVAFRFDEVYAAYQKQ